PRGRRRPHGFPGLRRHRAQGNGFRVRAARVIGAPRAPRPQKRARREECMNACRITPLALALLFVVASTPPALAQERGPLALSKASYFFVGGRIDRSVEGSPMVGHMYVE